MYSICISIIGYDSHLILPYLRSSILPELKSVSVIPKSGEKFMAITINRRVTFLDSKSFLAGSLDSLFETIKESCEFSIIKQSSLMNKNGKMVGDKAVNERLKYLTKKGAFPYNWAKNVEDYSSTKYLVNKNAFYNTLTRRHISDEEYKTAQEIWHVFEMNTMADYMEIYCMTDTLLLAEIFESFRTQCLSNFEIECCHFISLPGFAFQAFLKYTGVDLEYITDPEMLEMLEQNLTGGHSFSSQRYEESTIFKQQTLGENYFDGSKQKQQHLLYIDANNL